MIPCPRGGGGSAHSRESNYSGNTVNVNVKYSKCTCKSRMGWVQHNFIKDIKAKTHLSLASIGSKRENCTTDS